MKDRLSRLVYLALAAATAIAVAQPSPGPPHSQVSNEAAAVKAYEAARSQGPEALRAFLVGFPKGADLHLHLSGAVYAETFIAEAGQDGLCIDPDALKFVTPQTPDSCSGNLIPAKQLSGNILPFNQALYDKLVDAFSMRSYVPTPSWSGHDQFFATFGKFGGISRSHYVDWINEVANRAATQNQQYLELMANPAIPHLQAVVDKIVWPASIPDYQTFKKLLDQVLADPGLQQDIASGRQYALELDTQRKQAEHCDIPAQAAPACQVNIRFIFQVSRGNPPAYVFAQTVVGFEIAKANIAANKGGYVGINFVQPEDGFLSMRDYTLQMNMLNFLHDARGPDRPCSRGLCSSAPGSPQYMQGIPGWPLYDKVHIALHAGELAKGLVSPEAMSFHIRQALDLGHAERIGHGVDIMHETDAEALLKDMAAKHVMVEINLSSNEGILDVKGNEHPFPLYRAHHVPVALSTDDEGVSRIDITHEYVRAAIDYNLAYDDLKQLARTSLEHSFLSGADLWAQPDNFSEFVASCKTDLPGSGNLSTACKDFLASSEKATAEWGLEQRFAVYQSKW